MFGSELSGNMVRTTIGRIAHRCKCASIFDNGACYQVRNESLGRIQ
jgi:hypothetical protein